MRHKTNKIVLSGLFIALGIVIPFLFGHSFGMRGIVFLPMHMPVLLCGLTCGPIYGLLCGILTPLLSSAITGMPSTFPMLPVLICELSLYGMISGWTYSIKSYPIYLSLFFTIFIGRITNGIVLAVLLSLHSTGLFLLSAVYSVLSGLPGVIIQFLLVPILLRYFESEINKLEHS
ncbi:MAG: ECF transporter S component [Synergistaceae bacterium]|nr:ECF transporter S component [Synergistaceae bacterium]